MTRLPTESWEIHALQGPTYPSYKVGPLCAHPLCTRPADHAHHLFRRSFIIGDISWVRIGEQVVGNKVGICWRHHQEVTENRCDIIWDDTTRQFLWMNESRETIAPLSPQPPLHGAPINTVTSHGEQTPVGPAATERCATCGRPLPHAHDEKKEPARRRKTWVVLCPDDGEDGHLVLETLLDICRDLFKHDDNKATRYFSLVQALSLVAQHGHLMISEGQDESDVSERV